MPDTTEKLEAITKEEIARLEVEARKATDALSAAIARHGHEVLEPYLRTLVGKFFRTADNEHCYAIGVNKARLRLIVVDRADGIPSAGHCDWTWPHEGLRHGFTEISRAEYLSVAGPLFAELAEMAGITEGEINKQ